MTSSFGSIRISFRMWFADQLSATITGFTSRAMNISGGASSRAALSATETEMFFGTISPMVTCRKVTSSRATAKATMSAISTGMPTASSGTAIRWWIAGSATCRISSEQTVIPSCAQASINETFSMARRVVCARLDPASASGSIWLRRADMTANSAPTKKALPSSSTTSQRIPAQSLMRHRPGRWSAPRGAPGPA